MCEQVNILTGWAILDCINCSVCGNLQPVLYSIMEEPWSIHFCNSATLDSFWTWTTCLRSCLSILMAFSSGLWLSHSKIFLFFFSHPEVDLLVCFGPLPFCRTHICFSVRTRSNGQTFSFRIFWSIAEFMVEKLRWVLAVVFVLKRPCITSVFARSFSGVL